MKNYRYSAIDASGKTISNTMSADSPENLMAQVKLKSMYFIDFQEIQATTVNVPKLKIKSLVIFCRQLGTMLTAGIPISQALDMIRAKADSPKSRKVFSRVYEEVQKGNSLSTALQLQEGLFPSLLINMITAGEAGGSLDISMTRMADHYDKEHKLTNKVKGAMIYPLVLLFVAVAVVLILVTFVLPTITNMFSASQMPWTTKILLAFSHFLLGNWLLIIIFLAIAIVAGRFAMRIPQIKLAYDRMLLYLPIIGKLNQTIYSARCARTFASLYLSGVQALDMLLITGKVLNNSYLEKKFDQVIESVSRGEYISSAIADTGAFDPMLSSMIYIGEEAGSLGDILAKTADYFDNESDAAISRMVALLEPAMIIVLGIIIAFIVVSIMQPMFQMYDSVGGV